MTCHELTGSDYNLAYGAHVSWSVAFAPGAKFKVKDTVPQNDIKFCRNDKK